jgi:hypothetical protein
LYWLFAKLGIAHTIAMHKNSSKCVTMFKTSY